MRLSEGSRELLHYLVTVRGYAGDTISNYGRTHDQFLAFLRAQGLADDARHFTSENVFAFCSDLGQRGIAGNTIINKLHGLRALALYLMKRKDGRGGPVVKADPTRGFEWPKEVTPTTGFLYPVELSLLMALPLDPETALLREVLVDTGIRALEACEANVDDMREVDGTVYLTLRVKGRRGQNQEPASIPLSAPVAEALRVHITSRPAIGPDSPLFVTPAGVRYKRTQLSQLFIRLGKRAGITRISTSPHKLRHTANVIARIAGIDPLTRAAMLNHRSLRTLARYDHLVPGETAKGRVIARQGLADYLAQGHSGEILRHDTSEEPSKSSNSMSDDERNPCEPTK